MKKVFVYFMIILILVYSGCATIFSGSKQEIQLNSTPPGATILINGNDEGTTPAKVSLRKGKEYVIEFIKDGYKKKTLRLSYSLGIGWLILDIVVGLVGVIVDAATSNWYIFDFDYYNAVLER